MKVKEKEKKGTKKAMLTALKILIIAVLIIAIVSTVFIEIVTRPQKDTDADLVYVGGTVVSDSINYSEESTKKLQRNRIIKMMEMIWYFCADGDAKKHESQTPPDTESVKDIPYIDDGNIYHKLDVFYPKDLAPDEKLPVIIDIHGGGWMYATKDLNEYYCKEIASKGYIVFSISYRLVPDVTVNEQIQDCASALAWISENMSNYPANANTVMLTGDSAGGQLSAYCTVLNQSAELREVFGTCETNLNIKCLALTSPVAYMNHGGLFSVYTRMLWGKDYKQKPTYEFMDISDIIIYADDMPPTYFITSSGDTLAHDQTVTAYNLFLERGIECELVDFGEYEGKKLPHVFSVLDPFSEPSQQAIDGALDFYQRALLR